MQQIEHAGHHPLLVVVDVHDDRCAVGSLENRIGGSDGELDDAVGNADLSAL